MSIDDFNQSLLHPHPPAGISPLLLALWYDARGHWDKSHSIAQDIDGPDGARIHAYLHRKEGDIWNADYWYRQSGEKRRDISLEDEWLELVNRYLNR